MGWLQQQLLREIFQTLQPVIYLSTQSLQLCDLIRFMLRLGIHPANSNNTQTVCNLGCGTYFNT